ncbi:hypothetical protein [Thioclava sp.]|uniref:hypothetical protein n=1 Tax=Thioclava sp. TaxID=1933450 RepID=UPI003AA9CB79
MTLELPALDRWQFRLAPRPAPGPLRAQLEIGPDLPCTELRDHRGQVVGWLLGFGIDLGARALIGDHWQLGADCPNDPDGLAWNVLHGLGGRFLFLLDHASARRIYTDSSAQVPCVFDREKQIAGSTADAILNAQDYDDRFDSALHDQLGVNGEGWFPGGPTAHRGLSRVLPGHYLDLETWRSKRAWPHHAPEVAQNPKAAIDALIANVQAQIEALVTGPRKVALALTGGRETRMMLACARPFIDRLDCVTITGRDRHQTDTVLAKKITRELGLSHRELPRVNADPMQHARFLRRGGHCNGDSNALYHPSVWPIADSHVFLGGLGGEVARAFLWRKGDTPDMAVTPELLMRRFGLPKSPEIEAVLTTWLEDLPAMSALDILDLAYIDLRCGCWYGVQFCSDPTLVRHAPLFNYAAVELMLSLPARMKRDQGMADAVIERLWPELLRYPYNSLGRVGDTRLKLQRALADPRLVLKKLHKIR